MSDLDGRLGMPPGGESPVGRDPRAALDDLLEGCQVIGRDWRYLYLNDAAARQGRKEKDALLGTTMMQAYPGIDATPMFSVLRRCMDLREAQHIENEFAFSDGSTGWFELRFEPVPEGVVILSLDITERRRAEARTAHLNAVLRGIRSVNQLIVREHDPDRLIQRTCDLLVESHAARACMIVVGDDHRVKRVARTGIGVPGRAPKVLDAGASPGCVRQVLERLALDARPSVDEGVAPIPSSVEAEEDGEWICVRLDTEGRPFGGLLVFAPEDTATDSEQVELLREVAGDVAFALSSIEVAAERDDAVDRARIADARVEAVVQASPAAIFSFDAQELVLTWNPGAERLFGWSAAETFGKPVPIVPKDQREEFLARKERLLAGESFPDLEVERLRKDGSTVWVSLSTGPVRDSGGHVTAIMAVALDIDRRRAVEQERQTTLDYLRLVGDAGTTRDFVERTVTFFRKRLDFEAVGIRLKQGDDYPYSEARGFPERFVVMENTLCERDADGSIARDSDDKAVLGCMCGNVIAGRFDPSKPFFTAFGSFWTNSTSELLASTTEKDRLGRTRNRCNGEGYASVALIPLVCGDRRFGLLQLNDRRRGRFSAERVALFERFAAHLGVALAKTMADEALAESERRFRSLLDAVSDVVWAATPDGQRFLYLSPSAEVVYGRSRQEFYANGALWSDVVHAEDRNRVLEQAERLHVGGSVDQTYRIVRPDGEVRWIHDRKMIVREEGGRPIQMGGLVTDITERRLAEVALEASERRYRSLFANATFGIAYCRMIYDGEVPTDFVYLDVNSAFQELTGLPEVVGRRVSEIIPGIQRSDPGLFEIYGRTARSGDPERFEMYVEALGDWYDVSVYCPHHDHFVAVFDVISHRKKTEEKVIRFSERLERLAGVAQQLSQAHSLEAIAGVVRRSARELVAADGATFVLRDGDSCHYVEEDAIQPLWKGKRFPMSACISGWVMIHAEPVVIADIYVDERVPHDAYRPTFVRSLAMIPIRSKNPVGAIGVYWAATHEASGEEVRLLQALADSTSVAMQNARVLAELEKERARARAIYDHLPHPAFVCGWQAGQFVVQDFNEAARAATQGTASDFIGQPAGEVLEGISNLLEDLTHCRDGRAVVRREAECRLPGTNEPRQLVLTYGFVPPDMVLLYTEDVTEQRQTEEQLRLSQKLEAVGRLAGGVAHDFNNLLSVILSYAGFALDAVRSGDPLRQDLEEIRGAGERAAVLTRQLLAFSRKQVLAPEVVNLNAVVGGLETMLGRLIGEDVELKILLVPDLGNAKVDPSQIEQVIMNLAVNARDAMPDGGKLTIETGNTELDQEYADLHVGVTPGPFVLLSVSDTGIGMDEQTKQQIFEPFFTTKEAGKGTGLGLSTAYGIVKQSGGNIWVYSEPGKGTTFKVYLPREASATEAPFKERHGSERPAGNETILLVEDEEAVRKVTERILRSAGYTVLSASNGPDALELSDRFPGRVDLLLTDVVMPKMNGRELADRIKMPRPEIVVLYMSGYTDNAIVHHGVLDPGTNFVAKPINAGLLARKVRVVLDEACRRDIAQ